MRIPFPVTVSLAASLTMAGLSCRAEEKKAEAPAQPDKANPEVVAEVDATAITESDVAAKMAQFKAMLEQREMPAGQWDAMAPYIKNQIVEELITRALVDNECLKRRIIVNKDEIDALMAAIKAGVPEGEDFEAILKGEGLTREFLENMMRDRLKMIKLLNVPQPTEEEQKEFYEKNKSEYFENKETVKARHILIAFAEEDTAEDKAAKKAKLEGIRKQIVDGADFAELAAANSDCPSKERGGALGDITKGKMVPEFEKAAFEQKVNEVGPITETEYGYHIIQVTEHKQAETQPYEKVRARIPLMMQDEVLSKKSEELLKSLREKAKITYKAGAISGDAAAPPPAK